MTREEGKQFVFNREDFIDTLTTDEVVSGIQSSFVSPEEYAELYGNGADDGLRAAIHLIECEFVMGDNGMIEHHEVLTFLKTLLPPDSHA